MNKNKLRDTLPAMLLVKKVREFAGLNPWSMYKLMGRKTIQAYLSLERSAKRISLPDFYKLEEIYISHGGTREDFDTLARKCARSEK
jgi:hypothetical protein